jgi:hypothetical protein
MRVPTFAAACLFLAQSAAIAADAMSPSDIQTTFFNAQPFSAATPAGIEYKMIFTPDGKMSREPVGKSGYKSDGTWKLDANGFCTNWKTRRATCYTVIPSGNNKWSVRQGGTVIATWTK